MTKPTDALRIRLHRHRRHFDELETRYDAYLEKKQTTGGVVLNQNKHTFTMAITTTDYTNLERDITYYLTLNVKVTGIADFIELPIEDRAVLITSDTNRE